MTESQQPLPAGVYRAAQHRFDAISGSPWVYWLVQGMLSAYEMNSSLTSVAVGKHGLSTCDTFRYTRYWWESGCSRIEFGTASSPQVRTERTWFPFMKGGGFQRWYGNQHFVVNWHDNGQAIKADVRAKFPYLGTNLEFVLSSPEYYFREGVTWTKVSSKGFTARYMPAGFVIADAGMAFYAEYPALLNYLALVNCSLISYTLRSISPTINFSLGDVLSLPLPTTSFPLEIKVLAQSAVEHTVSLATLDDTAFDFVAPPSWCSGVSDLMAAQKFLAHLEHELDDRIYNLYRITDDDREAIEAELAGRLSARDQENEPGKEADEEDEIEAPITRKELAVRWISYAVGVLLGRFQPGVSGELGCAIYHREDFAIGSLPAPDEAEFDDLVGPTERFAYVDDQGGRHVFPMEVEARLRDLAVADGITLLDEGHPRDLPTLVEHALTLMLGAEATHAVIAEGANGSLRKFLERDFFTKWHLKWYRKRPVYWPLQSARRGYGFVLFHERIDRNTLYVLQRDYLDHKLNGLRLEIGDLNVQREGRTGRVLKQVEREIDQATQLLDELSSFGETIDRLAREGYEPEPSWIDDGVILRMAPLWELISIWKSEPKKYWDSLQQGQYDWSHIAMRYWPERVREKCVANKSFAIAHGHEEWHEDTK